MKLKRIKAALEVSVTGSVPTSVTREIDKLDRPVKHTYVGQNDYGDWNAWLLISDKVREEGHIRVGTFKTQKEASRAAQEAFDYALKAQRG